MITKKSNIIPGKHDAVALTGRHVEVIDSGCGLRIGSIHIVRSCDVRNDNINLCICPIGSEDRQRNNTVNFQHLYLLPATMEEFDTEISESEKLTNELKRRKGYLADTKTEGFDENGYKVYCYKKDIRENIDNEEELNKILKKMMGA